MVNFLPEVPKQVLRQSSKHLHSYNILISEIVLFKNKLCFRVGGGGRIPNKVYLGGGGIDDMVQTFFCPIA